MSTEQTPDRPRARQPIGDNGISAARLRLRKHPAMIPAVPLVAEPKGGTQEVMMRLVALESEVERLKASHAFLLQQYKAMGKTQDEPAEAPAEEPAEDPETVTDPAADPPSEPATEPAPE